MTTDITLKIYLWNIDKGKLLDPDPVEIKVNPKMQLCQFLVNISRKTGIDKLGKDISISTLDSEKRIVIPSPCNVKRTFEFNEISNGTHLAVTLSSPPQKPTHAHDDFLLLAGDLRSPKRVVHSPSQESLIIEVPPKSEIKPTKKPYQKNPMLDQLGAYFAQSVYLSAPDPSELPDPTGLFDD